METSALLPYDLFGIVQSITKKLTKSSKLHQAAAKGDCESILSIVESGFPVNFQSKVDNGNSALHYAAALDQPDAVQTLMSIKAYPQAIGSCGLTPLGMASRAGHERVIQVLVHWKIDLTKDRFLLIASLHNCFTSQSFFLLLQSGAMFHSEKDKNEALLEACRRKFQNSVERLLKEGADPNYQVDGKIPMLKYLGSNHYDSTIFRTIFKEQVVKSEPLTPSPCKNKSKVQLRFLHKNR